MSTVLVVLCITYTGRFKLLWPNFSVLLSREFGAENVNKSCPIRHRFSQKVSNIFIFSYVHVVEPSWSKTTELTMHITAIPRYNAVRITLIPYYAAIAYQPFIGIARFPPL
jgi:hypothetical protein